MATLSMSFPTIGPLQRHAALPVLRDARGTLLPTHGDAPVLRAANESAKQDKTAGENALRTTAATAHPARIAEQEQTQRLVAGCMHGDAMAWHQLVLSQHRRIYAICYRFTGSPTDAEDLTQEVFLKVYRNLASYDLGKGSFHTWLTTLTRNLLVDHFRRTRQDRATDSLDESLSGDMDGVTLGDRLADKRAGQHEQVAQLQLRAKVQHALKQLSPELREAVILRDLQDMDYKDIAAVLRIPEGTVKSRISRGRGELARILQRTEGQVM